MKKACWIAILTCCLSNVFSQVETIRLMALTLLDENESADVKINLLYQIREELEIVLCKSQTIDYDYLSQSLPMLQWVKSPDETFFIVTGEARIDEQYYEYFGGIYLLFEKIWLPFGLQLGSKPTPREFPYSIDEWQGGLYYQILPFKNRNKTYYVLLSYRYIDRFRREKKMEILYINEKNLLLGWPLIIDPKGQTTPHFSLEYAAEAPVFFNYDPLENKIVFDHLIPFKGLYENQGITWVPDGSYSAFELKKGLWHFVDKLPTQVLKQPPMNHSLPDKKKNKDILGRDKN